jgi:hypothetical protein
MSILPQFLGVFLFLAAWLSPVLGAQESKATKPNTKSTKTDVNSTTTNAADPCSEARRLMAMFLADTEKAAKMPAADREKNEREFVAKFATASKACSVAQQQVQPTQIVWPTAAQSTICTMKTGEPPEAEICALINKALAQFKPVHLASNRTLNRTAIEFSALSRGVAGATVSVLVTDPIGKNTVKLILPPSAEPRVAAERVVAALDEILQRPATTTNVGWVLVVPAPIPK